MTAGLFADDMQKGAVLSACGRYRYTLWRQWNADLPVMAWVLLNPSTADASADDPTLRKCIGFARRHGCGGVTLVNLFAWRSKSPKDLPRAADPIGPENDAHIAGAVKFRGGQPRVVVAWGAHQFARKRAARVAVMLQNLVGRHQLQCLGMTGHGAPWHPLYLRYDTPLQEWR